MQTSRRQFVKEGLLLGTLTTMGLNAAAYSTNSSEAASSKNSTLLFQGDSITDGNRTRNNDWNHVMGHGYAFIVTSRLSFDFPANNYHFFNRGVSGNTITDLANRWQADTLDLKPDVLSILVGINDSNYFLDGNLNCSVENFETTYRKLLGDTKTQLPQSKLILMEPFILPVGKIKERWDLFKKDISKRQLIVAKLAHEFGAIFIPLQEPFNKALQKAPAEYWIWDGIHPMPAGHELIARQWIKLVKV